MSPVIAATLLLIGSNIFMTFAWYAHLKNLAGRPWYVAALVSWSIAFFEYLLQVPGNRIGYEQLSLPQLKILQEVSTLGVFVPFAVFYMQKTRKLDYLWAALCILVRYISCSVRRAAHEERHGGGAPHRHPQPGTRRTRGARSAGDRAPVLGLGGVRRAAVCARLCAAAA
jgi:uncharacterized protein